MNIEVFNSNECEEQFWDVRPRSLGNICQSFGGICWLHLRSKRFYSNVYQITRCHFPEVIVSQLM